MYVERMMYPKQPNCCYHTIYVSMNRKIHLNPSPLLVDVHVDMMCWAGTAYLAVSYWLFRPVVNQSFITVHSGPRIGFALDLQLRTLAAWHISCDDADTLEYYTLSSLYQTILSAANS